MIQHGLFDFRKQFGGDIYLTVAILDFETQNMVGSVTFLGIGVADTGFLTAFELPKEQGAFDDERIAGKQRGKDVLTGLQGVHRILLH